MIYFLLNTCPAMRGMASDIRRGPLMTADEVAHQYGVREIARAKSQLTVVAQKTETLSKAG